MSNFDLVWEGAIEHDEFVRVVGKIRFLKTTKKLSGLFPIDVSESTNGDEEGGNFVVVHILKLSRFSVFLFFVIYM